MGGRVAGGLQGLGKSTMGKLGAAGVGLGAAYNGYTNYNDDSLSGTDAFLKTLDQNKGAIIGAALAGIFTGGAGAVGGAAIGGMVDSMLPTFGSYGDEQQDFVSRPGQNPVSFSGDDTLVGAKKGGPIDKMLNDNTKGTSGGSTVSVKFDKPLMVQGSIDLTAGNQKASIDLNDPILMRELSRVIQEQLSKAVGGGKISSTPALSY
jgi:hypothetical protein